MPDRANAYPGRPKLKLRCPVVVEGKYDKIKLDAVVSTPILVLNGFSVFKDDEKQALLKRICKETGLILLTDSDRAGQFLRNRLKGVLPSPDSPDGKRIYQVYAPARPGKEKRKQAPSADGILGIEGTDVQTLYELLLPFSDEQAERTGAGVSPAEWFKDGFSGTDNASDRRKELAAKLDLPETLSSKALMEAVNLLVSRAQYEEARQCIGRSRS